MQNQNMQTWSWNQPGASPFPGAPLFPTGFPSGGMDQSQIMPGYQQMYGGPPPQSSADYGAAHWSAAQIQHWQQWQQWQEKYQQWQAQYGKKYAETIAAMGQSPGIVVPNMPPPTSAASKPNDANPGYTTANPPPPPANAQPVPPPPPEEGKSADKDKDKNDSKPSDAEQSKDVEELSEAEKTFDVQFKQWEDQFNEWKKQNQDHPDKAQYREYEKKWETWREQLLQRREQMRKKRLNKMNETLADGKTDESKGKAEQDRNVAQAKETTNSAKIAENQSQGPSDSKAGTFVNHEGQSLYHQYKAEGSQSVNVPGNYVAFPGPEGNALDNRMPGYYDRDNQNLGGQVPPFGFAPFDNKFQNTMDVNKDFQMGQRYEGRGDFLRRPFGNGNFEEDRNERNFGARFGNFDNRKLGPDRFPDNRMKDGKFNFGVNQFNEQSFTSGARNYQDRGFAGDMKQAPFAPNVTKNSNSNSFQKPKVPSLFEITVQKPPGLRSPGKERKPKPWEQEKDAAFEEKKDEKRNESPWLSGTSWTSSNSPWIKPWELDRVVAEKPPDASLRPDAWQRESLAAADMMKSEMDKSELSGYVGKILAKLGNFNVLPPNAAGKDGCVPGFVGDHPGKADGKGFMHGPNWPGKGDSRNPGIFAQDGPGGFPGNFAKDNRGDDLVLFGKGDCDERFRFDRDRPGFRRDERSFDSFRRDERGPFPDLPNRDAEDRFPGKGERNAFGRDERPSAKFDDVDDRMLRNRNGRRGFDDRDDRGFRGIYDRDERRSRAFGGRFGRGEPGSQELDWNPQVFDYSKGNSQNFRGGFSDQDKFQMRTVVDYSHGENKQTFDYGHGESKNESLPVKSFDYGHGAASPAVIDYGHGGDKDVPGVQQWKKEGQDKTNERRGSRSKSRSPQRPSRSPRGRPRSRSRSPHSRGKRYSHSPPYRGCRSRSRDRFNRQTPKRNRRNNSEEKSLQSTDGDIGKNSFDITTVLVEDLICSPGRETRPNKLVFIMRGLPGSGKTYVTKLIKDKEVELGGDAPRILSLDDYFMTEVEKEVVDEETGRKMKKKVLEYEYESCAEPHYRGSLLKAFKKTISDGFFSFIIVDSVNEKTKDYEEMWSFAKQKGFQVYVAEMDDDVAVCTKRNIHKRTEKEISDLAKAWEKTPNHYLRLDVRSLLQADAITEVEMEVVSDTDLDKMVEAEAKKEKSEEENKEDEEEEEPGESAFVKSRWDHFENSEQKLDRLDGLKRRREGHATMQDYLQLPDDFDLGPSEPTDGKKKVRWADLEERRQQEKMRAIGFVVGQTDWSRMTDPTFGESALTRTKYI